MALFGGKKGKKSKVVAEIEAILAEGDDYLKKGNTEKAASEYRRAHRYLYREEKVSESPEDFSELYTRAGHGLFETGEPDRAIECFDKATQLMPDNVDAWLSRGMVHLNNKTMLNYALMCFNEVLKRYPNSVEALENKAEALMLDNKKDEAVEVYNKLINVNPNNKAEYEEKLGGELPAEQAPLSPMDQINEALRNDPMDAGAWKKKAELWLEENNTEKAVECFLRLGHLTGDPAIYEKVLELDPNNESAKSKLGELKPEEDVTEPAITEPTVEPEHVMEPIAEPEVSAESEMVTEPVPEPEMVSEPVSDTISEPIVEEPDFTVPPVEESPAEEPAEPVIEEPAPEAVIEEPTPEPAISEPIPETVSESVAEGPAFEEPLAEEPIAEPVIEPVSESVAEGPAFEEPPAEEPIAEPVIEPVSETVPEAEEEMSQEELVDKGDELFGNEQYEEALDYFKKIAEKLPDNQDALHNMAAVYYKLDRFDEAISTFDRLIEIEPNDVTAYLTKGAALYWSGKYTEAIDALNNVVKRDSNDGAAWYYKACAESKNGNDKLVIPFLKRAADLDPEFKERAKDDDAFDSVRDNEEFQRIVG